MELIKEIESKRDKDGNLRKCGKFKCSFCLQEIERPLNNGKRQQSCGCVHYELSAKIRKGQKRTEKQRKKYSEAKKGEKNPMYGKSRFGQENPFYGKKHSIETKRVNSEYHKILIGPLSPNWNNGSSFEIYSQEFKRIRKFILKRDDYVCQFPNCIEIHDRLHVHHIDYNKKNNNPKNLITLGTSCHTKTNGKKLRNYWTEFYQNIMIYRIIDCLL